MNKKAVLFSASLILVALLTDSCGPRDWDMYAPGENLSSLTKITDMEDICEYPLEVIMVLIFSSQYEIRGGLAVIYIKEIFLLLVLSFRRRQVETITGILLIVRQLINWCFLANRKVLSHLTST